MTDPEAVRSLARSGDGAAALELAASAWRDWLAAGTLEEGRAVLAETLGAPGADVPSAARVRVLYADGLLTFRQGDQESSRKRNEEALTVARAAGDRRGESDALVGLSRVSFRDGDYDRVRELAQQARELAREVGGLEAEAAPLHMLAAGTRLRGDYERARELYEESLELGRARENAHSISMELHNLGWVELHLENQAAAAARFAERGEAVGATDAPYEVAMESLNDAALAWSAGEHERAAELLRAAEATLAEAGTALDPDDAFEVAWLRERLAF